MNSFGVTYHNLRGTNYLFNSTLQRQADFSLLSWPTDAVGDERAGTYSRVNVESELALLAASGFNNLRIWPPFFGWIIDRAQFRRNLTDFIDRCRAHRITLTWVLWNGIGNGILWTSHDLIEIVREASGDATSAAIYENLEILTDVFQQRHGQWVPPDKPWHLTGYPAPGNNLLKESGNPDVWADLAIRDHVHGFVDEVLDLLGTDAGQATLFQIDLANELDGVFIPLPNIVEFLAWNHAKVRAVLPDAALTVGWAFHDIERYGSYVAAIRESGIDLARHSFHVYVRDPSEYEDDVITLIDWSAEAGLTLMVTEFYRIDTAEWGRLQVGLDFFERHAIPTIMWGFINSNIYDDPGKPGNKGTPHLDGVMTATNMEFNVAFDFRDLDAADRRAVLDYNARAPRLRID